MNAVSDFNAHASSGKKSQPQTVTLSVRLTLEERARLDELAGDRPMSAFVRSRLFGKGGVRKSNARRTTSDNVALARVLAALGRSGLSADLKTLVLAAENERLSMNADSLTMIRRACIDIAEMRRDLIAALKLTAQ